MEELQDAIEDAQYVNAIATQEEGPRPVLAWEIPTEEQLDAWRDIHSLSARSYATIDGCCSSAIGLFLFSAYLKETCDDYLRINFIEELLRCRKLRGKLWADRARKIVDLYLREVPLDKVTGERILPEKTQIDEYDLSRPESNDLGLWKAEFAKMVDLHLNGEEKRSNCLGIHGPALDELFDTIDTVDAANRLSSDDEAGLDVVEELAESAKDAVDEDRVAANLRKQKEKYSSMKQLTQSLKDQGGSDLPETLFDKIDAIVVESLRRDHWQGFMESDYSTRLRNFLWFQDRPCLLYTSPSPRD